MADALARLRDAFGMDWKLVRTDQPVKVLILVSRFDHCLAYLLYKVRMEVSWQVAHKEVMNGRKTVVFR